MILGVENTCKHKHVYEFLRNAIKMFDHTKGQRKIPELPADIWNRLSDKEKKLAFNNIVATGNGAGIMNIRAYET